MAPTPAGAGDLYTNRAGSSGNLDTNTADLPVMYDTNGLQRRDRPRLIPAVPAVPFPWDHRSRSGFRSRGTAGMTQRFPLHFAAPGPLRASLLPPSEALAIRFAAKRRVDPVRLLVVTFTENFG
jgi:hypothetical protein